MRVANTATATHELIELGAPCLGDPEKRALCEVIDEGWVTMGERVRRFERAFAAMHGVGDAIAVNSATAALQLCMAAFDIGPGDEVLVPALTFVATSNVILRAGATPVFVDIQSRLSPQISLEEAATKLTPRTRAIVLVHYAGYLIDMAPWREFADRHGLLLFEDAAHAAGISGPGLLSDAAAFSFFTNKNMTTAEGGMMIVRDPEARERTRHLRSHGMTATTLDRARGRAVGYDVVECGFNFRMDELRAAIGLVQIERLRGWNAKRRDLTAIYRSVIGSVLPSLSIPFSDGHPTTAHIMPVLLPAGVDRQKVMQHLRNEGIQTSVHYPPIHRFAYYRREFGDLELPHTEQFSDAELTLPLHPRLLPYHVERVVSALAAAVNA
jgi:dTDP-4-amino-4,6-dideoxygalactose transaminase